ncbi:MAG: hypothetical protein WC220_09255 [Pedobacter sp.]|jgi:hypothetical protein
MKTPIRNVDELRAEVLRLREQRLEMESDMQLELSKIVSKFRLPLMLLGKLNDWFGVFSGLGKNKKGSSEGNDLVSGIFRIGLPFLMDKFVFPKSGFITRTVLELLTKKAANVVNKDLISNLIDKVSEWVNLAKGRKKNGPELADYGIPPDSETY